MKDLHNNQKRDRNVVVTILFTESTTSLLNLSAPHLEHFHPDDSKLCLITGSDLVSLLHLDPHDHQQASTSHINDQTSDVEGGEPCGVYTKITEGLAFFSLNNDSSVSCMYEISDEDLKAYHEVNSKENSLAVFETIKTKNSPFVSVRSMAHNNRLGLISNDIFVSLVDSDSQSSSEYICRICHGGESFDDLLTPCRCRGTVALVHMTCLERWLKESNHTHCELCQHHYKIVREPKYSIFWSIFVFLRHPGDHYKEMLLDLLAFAVYTPSAVTSTYMLLMICEALVKSNIVVHGSIPSHVIAFSAVLGMAIIDFAFSSWFIMCLQKHYEAWREWYNNNSTLKVILPTIKRRPHRKKKKAASI